MLLQTALVHSCLQPSSIPGMYVPRPPRLSICLCTRGLPPCLGRCEYCRYKRHQGTALCPHQLFSFPGSRPGVGLRILGGSTSNL